VLSLNLDHKDVNITHFIIIIGIHLGLFAINTQYVVKDCDFLN
jgi:hypothetical protein